MNDLESMPHEPENNPSSFPDQNLPQVVHTTNGAAELLQSWPQSMAVPPARIPHLGHLCLLGAFLFIGFVCVAVLTLIALHFHLDGVSTQDQIKNNVHYLLGTDAVLYLVTLALSYPIFPLLWKKSFFSGIQWRAATVPKLGWRLPAIALGCFVLAVIDEKFLPGPEHAPIEEFFRAPGAAWLMFAFGVTFAPFFEEMGFRGFLLPALTTAFDWIAEKTNGSCVIAGEKSRSQWPQRGVTLATSVFACPIVIIFTFVHYGGRIPLGIAFLDFLFAAFMLSVVLYAAFVPSANLAPRIDSDGHPRWSIPAMVIASIPTSLLFAVVHAEQQGHSLGPFLQVITVSLILCAVRLVTRSLAASTVVHACYNFLLFFTMLVGTGGFRHFENM